MRLSIGALFLAALVWMTPGPAGAAAERSGDAVASGAQSSPPEQLHLQWMRQLPPRKPAWALTPMMPKDWAYEPAVCGDLVLVGCSHNDAVMAFDRASGAQRWRFYTNGPIHYAPVPEETRVYVGSDDGYLYCLNGATCHRAD